MFFNSEIHHKEKVMGKTAFEVNLPALAHYDKSLLDKPINELTGPEAVMQLLYLVNDRHSYEKDPRKGVSVALSEELTIRRDELAKMLAQGFAYFNYSGKAVIKSIPGQHLSVTTKNFGLCVNKN